MGAAREKTDWETEEERDAEDGCRDDERGWRMVAEAGDWAGLDELA